jgi:hypothetical protein
MKKDLARFSSSAGKFVPGSTDGQWKRFKRLTPTRSRAQPSLRPPEQEHPTSFSLLIAKVLRVRAFVCADGGTFLEYLSGSHTTSFV